MKLHDIMDLINDVEDRFPVDEWLIDGIGIWPLVRIKLHFDLFYAFKTSSSSGLGPRVSRYARYAAHAAKGTAKFLFAVLRGRANNSRPQGRCDTIFLSDGISYVFLENAWYEKFCDPFIDIFRSKNITSLLLSPEHTYYIPRHSPSMFIQADIDRIRIKNQLFDGAGPSDANGLRGYEAYAEYLRARSLPLPIDTVQNLRKHTAFIKRLSAFYKRILMRTRPSLGFVVSYYCDAGMAFNLACRESGIPSVEIQHGGGPLDLHVAYARWNKVPKEGYPLLPSLFWCWNKADAAAVRNWNSSCSQWHDAIGGGNLFLDLWRDSSHRLVRAYDRQIASLKVRQSTVTHILFTIQEKFADIDTLRPLLEVMQKTGAGYFWWIRLHPCIQYKTRKFIKALQAREIGNYDVLNATSLPLYALLRNVDLHITHSSSSVVEATAFRVPTVLVGEYGTELFPDQISSGWARPAFTAPDIIEAIKLQLGRAETLRSSHPHADDIESGGIDILLRLIGANPKSHRPALKNDETPDYHDNPLRRP